MDAFVETAWGPDGSWLLVRGDLDLPTVRQSAGALAEWRGGARRPLGGRVEPAPGLVSLRGEPGAEVAVRVAVAGPEGAARWRLLAAAWGARAEAEVVAVTPAGGPGLLVARAEGPDAWRRLYVGWFALGALPPDAEELAVARAAALADDFVGPCLVRWGEAGPARYEAALRATDRAQLADEARGATDLTGLVRGAADERALAEELHELGANPPSALVPGATLTVRDAGGDRVVVSAWLAGGAAAVPPERAGTAEVAARLLAEARAGEPPFEVTVRPDSIRLRAEVAPDRLYRALRGLVRRLTAATVSPAQLAAAQPADPLTPAWMEAWMDTHVAHAPVRVEVRGPAPEGAVAQTLRVGLGYPRLAVLPAAPPAVAGASR